MGGITVYQLRLLCENPWNGGAGYTPEQVSQMTLDQICFRLCDMNTMKKPIGQRSTPMQALAAKSQLKAAADGTIAGRSADGTLIRGRIAGKSKARQLMEAAEQKRKADQEAKKQANRKAHKRK